MKRILLISNYVFHYRQKVYNDFADRFAQDGYEFHVLSDAYQQVGYPLRFQAHTRPMSLQGYTQAMGEIAPDGVILFLHLRDRIFLPLIGYCRAHHIPVLFWGKGVSTTDPDNVLKNLLYHHIHHRCDALITYSEQMRRSFLPREQHKLFVAPNTLSFAEIDPDAVASREQTRLKYGIREGKVLLFISRMLPYKRADILLEAFADEPDVAVVLVGPGLPPEQQELVSAHGNLYYLGERYADEVNELYKLGDVFSTPGSIGLAMNEAMFWGLPVVVLRRGQHGPELSYLHDGVTGYLCDSEQELAQRIRELLRDDKKRRAMSDATRLCFAREISMERMYQGFLSALHHCGL